MPIPSQPVPVCPSNGMESDIVRGMGLGKF